MGDYNSFQSIAISRNTSLAIVAPGITEALFATALGLLAAIPAVDTYNKFNNDTIKYFKNSKISQRDFNNHLKWLLNKSFVRIMSEINVTPFVDVMLVLLIILW